MDPAGVATQRLRDGAPTYRTPSRRLRMRTVHDMTGPDDTPRTSKCLGAQTCVSYVET